MVETNDKFVFKPGEICILKCDYENDGGQGDGICPGKNQNRRNDFICDYSELKACYERGKERESKKFAEAVSKRHEQRQK